MDSRWADTKFVVQATDTEQFFLWQQHSSESDCRMEDRRGALQWEQDHSGICATIGTLDGRPVAVCVSWAILNGIRVAFYEPVSQVVDWKMVDEWLNRTFTGRWDGGHRRAHCNAMNFHHCLDYLRHPDQR